MFSEDEPFGKGDRVTGIRPVVKKCKSITDDSVVHSSLTYHSITAPPLIDYKTIEGYCGNKRGQSFLPSKNQPSTAGINDVQNITNPIVFKTPKPSKKVTSSETATKPYAFFSVEELSLVKCLRNWANTKVCAIGMIEKDEENNVHSLLSVSEQGHWKILLDINTLTQAGLRYKVPVQVYGFLSVDHETPKIKVKLFRSLVLEDIPLLVKSYHMMQKYIPAFVKPPEKNVPETGLSDHLSYFNSPIVLKTQKKPPGKLKLEKADSKPYAFFYITELSLVKCLKNWVKTKVCTVGTIHSDEENRIHRLLNTSEHEHWQILLDMNTSIQDIKRYEYPVQVFGILSVVCGAPHIKVESVRFLSLEDIPLLVESYSKMKKYVPAFVESLKKSSCDKSNETSSAELNETLDDYDFSQVA